MKVIQSKGKTKIVVVCCLHGDEVFGERIFSYYQDKLEDMAGIRLILANEEAYNKNVRFIDDDLNRNFPGDEHGNHEEQLAAKILPYITDAEYILDIHTTTSDIVMTPIVASLNKKVKDIINLTTSNEVAYMTNGISDHALIGQVSAGVSLEFNEMYAQSQQALDDMVTVIEGLLSAKKNRPVSRRVYMINGTIPLNIELPSTTLNFQKVASLGFHPFLLHEKSYKTHQGFSANEFKKLLI